MMSNQKTELNQAAIDVLEAGKAESQKLLSRILVEFSSDSTEEAKDWQKRILDVNTTSATPTAVIGVVGSTGVGKSKCINALLEKDLLPTSDSQACTAAPVEVCYNDSEQGAPFRATVDFINATEWERETQILIRELLDDQNNLDWNAIESNTDNNDHGAIVKQAYEKVKAVCPRLIEQRPAKLAAYQLSHSEIQKVLGQRVLFEGYDLDDFSDLLAPYICSSQPDDEERSFELWPLIRKICVYDKASILREGVRLVDLPGVQDNNAARAAVADSYLEQCTSILVMAPIVRAQSDKVATDFLRSFLASQLDKSGILQHVSFVCTRIDESLDDTARITLRLSKKIGPLRKEIAYLEQNGRKSQQRLEKIQARLIQLSETTRQSTIGIKRQRLTGVSNPNKRQRQSSNDALHRHDTANDDDSIDDDSMQTTAWEDDNSYASYIGHGVMNDGCIPAMDREKEHGEDMQLRVDHADVIIECSKIEAKIKNLTNQIRRIRIRHRNDLSCNAIQKQFAAEMKKKNGSLSGESDDSITIQPEVFCVCAPAYLGLRRGGSSSELASGGFSDEEDTGIPALRNHCCRFAMDLRMKALKNVTLLLLKLVISLRMWTSDKFHATNMAGEEFENMQRGMEDSISNFKENMKGSVDKIMNAVEIYLERRMTATLDEAYQDGITNMFQACAGWAALPAQTYQAIVRRDGYFQKSHYHRHDFNDDLAFAFDEKLRPVWQNFFYMRIPQLFDAGATRCTDEMKNFDEAFRKRLKILGTVQSSLSLLRKQTQTSASIIESHFESAKQTIVEAKKCRADANKLIKISMRPTYQRAKLEKGKGVRHRMVTIMTEGITSVGPKMFKSLSNSMMHTIRQTFEFTRSQLYTDMYRLADAHSQDCRSCLMSKDREALELQVKHSQVIFPMVIEFEAKYLKGMVSLLQSVGYGIYNLDMEPLWELVQKQNYESTDQEYNNSVPVKQEKDDDAWADALKAVTAQSPSHPGDGLVSKVEGKAEPRKSEAPSSVARSICKIEMDAEADQNAAALSVAEEEIYHRMSSAAPGAGWAW